MGSSNIAVCKDPSVSVVDISSSVFEAVDTNDRSSTAVPPSTLVAAIGDEDDGIKIEDHQTHGFVRFKFG